ncbi:MAG: argininosuccinate lyase [Deltaproteobacteria bacterium]|nr:argininosuccinate lyase [Deltaproteobacteria bacterium]MBN2670929.1 argininosuccinate lyase [Deltaproteobacteria bacterium]
MTLYKGRIDAAPNELMDALNKSLPVDIRFFPYDVNTNRVWATELERIGIFTEAERKSIHQTLDSILARYHSGEFHALPDDEDIHTLTERLLTEQLGDTGARIHTGRSRNDQVACDLYQYLMDQLNMLKSHLHNLISIICDVAKTHTSTLLAGTTHLQPAQPITLGHFLMSLGFALQRDFQRADDAIRRVDRCPLGAGAIAGCGFVVNRTKIATELGFSRPTDNSIDTISDRDVAQEVAFVCASTLTHLSRYAEQFVIWSNPAFGYVKWDAQWSTGSSMMPQKRNPDAMELVRAKAARAAGNVTTLLSMTKGVPLSYAKDLQEDKEAVFDSIDTALLTIQVFGQALKSAVFNPDQMKKVLTSDMLATDLADALVEKGIPFRKAHERTAQFVTFLEDANRDLLNATVDEMNSHFPEFKDNPLQLGYEASLERRSVIGGTAPSSVASQIKILKDWLSQNTE